MLVKVCSYPGCFYRFYNFDTFNHHGVGESNRSTLSVSKSLKYSWAGMVMFVDSIKFDLTSNCK